MTNNGPQQVSLLGFCYLGLVVYVLEEDTVGGARVDESEFAVPELPCPADEGVSLFLAGDRAGEGAVHLVLLGVDVLGGHDPFDLFQSWLAHGYPPCSL